MIDVEPLTPFSTSAMTDSDATTSDACPLSLDLSDEQRFLPEGPYAMAEGKLSWVGIQHGSDSTVGSLNVLDLDSMSNVRHDLPARPGFAFPCTGGRRFVVGMHREVGVFDAESGTFEAIAEGIDGDQTNTIINDGVLHGDHVIFGTKDLEFATKKAGLYLLNLRDGRLIRLRDDQICSNGKVVLSGDDASLAFLDIDSPTRTVVRYDLDLASGDLSPATKVLDFDDDPAVPDGMVGTPDGRGVIVAMFRPEVADHGETRWYELDGGHLRHVWKTPHSPQNTCPALVPTADGSRLIITTAIENFDAESVTKCPAAGKLFLADVTSCDFGDVTLPPAASI